MVALRIDYLHGSEAEIFSDNEDLSHLTNGQGQWLNCVCPIGNINTMEELNALLKDKRRILFSETVIFSKELGL